MTLLEVLDQSGGPMCEAAAARIRELQNERDDLALKQNAEWNRANRLEAALTLIAAMRDKCVFNLDPAFREGSCIAFNQAADIARDALTPSETPEAMHARIVTETADALAQEHFKGDTVPLTARERGTEHGR